MHVQARKGNEEDVKDLREVIKDRIGIVGGRIDQLDDQARADIEELHECACPLVPPNRTSS